VIAPVIDADTRGSRLLPALAALAALGYGLLAGLAVVKYGPSVALGLTLVPPAVIAALRSIWVSYMGVIALLCLLPYATLPLGGPVTPALLTIALLTCFGLLAAVTFIDRREYVQTGGPHALVLGLLGVTAFAFLIGYGRGYTTQTMHDYFKFVLGIAAFFLTVQLVRRFVDAERVLWLLALGIGGAALIALGLYAGGPAATERVLARLIPYGYPGWRIVRFIEDDPTRAMRAVGTGVDPNSFGGLLMVGFVLAVGQLLVRGRTLPLWAATGIAVVSGLAMLLTYSRGAWVGAMAGVGLIVLLRRPWLALPIGALGVVAVSLGVGAGFVQRLWLGFTLQDPATRLRLAEYRNAWEIIRRHPWFGVGFGDAPSIELQAGVSSIYLTIAERAGLIGLTMFLAAVGVIFWRGLRASTASHSDARADLAVCFTGALAAALTVGLVDHYFFNPQFPHMATLLWIIAGVIVALTRMQDGALRRVRGVSSTQRVTGALPGVRRT
jgi:polysaccharide biosynthesis protein PslJ